jgi:microcin C transport system substrate-binding protein
MSYMKSLCAAVFASLLVFFPLIAPAHAEDEHRHALSLVGKIKYPPDFKRFDYVNPDAPKGGTIRMPAIGTFDTLNVISMKGQLPNGLVVQRAGLIYDSLLYESHDESSTAYGLLAEWVSYPPDYSSATFKLRENARWHDGTPITPEDIIFSVKELKEGQPHYAKYYTNVERVEKTGDHLVTFYFNVQNNRELPFIVGEFPVQPKHFWTGKTADGKARDPQKSSMEIPLGSGPYRVKSADPGRSIVYERVPDYWGKDLPVRIGMNNFNEIKFEFFREFTPAFEAFKKGDLDYYHETSAKAWATGYDFPALTRGDVIKDGSFEPKTGAPMQAFIFNIRRSRFADPRVREAFNLAFDFEWSNQNLFYGQYRRVGSYFERSEMAAQGLPQGKELEILESVRAEVPPQVFNHEYKNPVNAAPEAVRDNLRQAGELLTAAGWTIKDGVRKNAAGETLTAEFLISQPIYERILMPYIKSLERIGVKSAIRLIDSAQFDKRMQTFDFDIVIHSVAQSDSPGNEQRDYWSSQAADINGSQNVIGIKNPAVDKLIDRIILAKDREELVAACRALDRVLLWNQYLVPQWYAPNERFAYWTRLAHPAPLPSRRVGIPEVWWFDADKLAGK